VPTARFARLFAVSLAVPIAIGLASLGGCAAPRTAAVQEALDERTGTTITRIAKPITFVTNVVRGAKSDPFASLAPFETNRQGARQIYLWLAVPDELERAPIVEVRIDGVPLAPGAVPLDMAGIGLGGPAYPAPAPWSAVRVFSLDEKQYRALERAGSVRIIARFADGAELPFAAEADADASAALRQFAGQIGLD
jgi:hypothetical protein